MAGNIFGGGGFFGKPLKVVGQPGAQVPLAPQAAQPQAPAGQLGVVPPPRSAMGPQGPVPMGDKKDCPVCRG